MFERVTSPPLLGILNSYAEGARSVASVMDAAESVGLPMIVDSGAFSVFKGTAKIDVNDYSEFVKEHQHRAGFRFIALDVVGDEPGSFDNWMRQVDAGALVEPTIHYDTAPEFVDGYVRHGLVTPWVNYGGLAPVPKVQHRRVVAWCAAIKRRLPAGTRLHGLACTAPTLTGPFPFDSVDSVHWSMNLIRHRAFALFDPARGRWTTNTRMTKRYLDGYADGWTWVHRHGSLLRNVYEVEPLELFDADDPTLLRLRVRATALYAAHLRQRHGSHITIHLAAADVSRLQMIADESEAVSAEADRSTVTP